MLVCGRSNNMSRSRSTALSMLCFRPEDNILSVLWQLLLIWLTCLIPDMSWTCWLDTTTEVQWCAWCTCAKQTQMRLWCQPHDLTGERRSSCKTCPDNMRHHSATESCSAAKKPINWHLQNGNDRNTLWHDKLTCLSVYARRYACMERFALQVWYVSQNITKNQTQTVMDQEKALWSTLNTEGVLQFQQPVPLLSIASSPYSATLWQAWCTAWIRALPAHQYLQVQTLIKVSFSASLFKRPRWTNRVWWWWLQ